MNNEPIISRGKAGIEKVSHPSLGFALIKVSAFENIPAPHFEVRWSTEHNLYFGEDNQFYFLLAKSGVDLYVDHDATRYVSHVGEYNYQEDFSAPVEI